MGRKSKKSIANKLAKMSDEERAKYMQRKADAEEEIKRRREQLIATFIKNKLKREEGYGRLNLAKINQHWHQLLRKQKCKQMKEEVGHLKKWIGRVYKLKEKTINNLIDELEEAETQLQNNFQAHVLRIDELIGITGKHEEYLKKMHSQYEKDRNGLIETFLTERRNIMEKSFASIEFLKCLVYGNDEKRKNTMKENEEKHVQKLINITADYHIEYEKMEKDLKTICCYMAKKLSDITKNNFTETSPKRAHYQGLLKFDQESAIIIKKQFEYIQQKEDFLKRIEKRYSELKESRQKQLQVDQFQLNYFKDCLFAMRKRMLSDIKLDEKRRIILIDCSSKAIKNLERIFYKGQQVLQLAQTCENLETQSDEVSRWRYLFQQEKMKDHFDIEDDYSHNDYLYEDSEIETERKSFNEDECYFRRINMLHSPYQKIKSNLKEFGELNISDNTRTSTSSAKSNILSSTSQSSSFNVVPLNKTDEIKHNLLISTRSYPSTIRTFSDSKFTLKRSESSTLATQYIQKIIQPKKSNSAPASLISRKPSDADKENEFHETSPSIIRILDEFKSLEGMEKFWAIYNKIEVEHIRLKNEKFVLLKENKQLKDKLTLLFQTHNKTNSLTAPASVGNDTPTCMVNKKKQ